MRNSLFSASVLTGLLAICTPSTSQVSSPTGSQGSYEEHGQDYGYDNMQADTAHHDELAIGAALVKQQKYGEAIPHLELARQKHPRNVSVLLYLGFAHRMMATATTGDAQVAEFKTALDYYKQALAVDADSRLLHEYLGKLYLLTREYELAASEAKTLETLCPSGCDERTALTQALAANPPPPKVPATPPAHQP